MLLSDNYSQRYNSRTEKILEYLLHWRMEDLDDEISLEEETRIDTLISDMEDYFLTMQEKDETFHTNNGFRTQFSEVAFNFIALWYHNDESKTMEKAMIRIVVDDIEVHISEIIERNFGDLFIHAEYDEETNFFQDIYAAHSGPCAKTVWEECGDCVFSPEVADVIDDTIIQGTVKFIEMINITCEKVLELLQFTIPDFISVTLNSILEEIIRKLQDSMATNDPVWKDVVNRVNLELELDVEDICKRIYLELDDALAFSYIEAATALYAQHIINMNDKEVNQVAQDVKAMEI